jgi:hypothetical protein
LIILHVTLVLFLFLNQIINPNNIVHQKTIVIDGVNFDENNIIDSS